MKTLNLLCLAILLLGGCSINTARESLTVTIPATADRSQVTLQWKSEIRQVLWLYFTKTKQVERVTPFSSTSVGEIEAEPDNESIESAGGFIGELMRGLIVK